MIVLHILCSTCWPMKIKTSPGFDPTQSADVGWSLSTKQMKMHSKCLTYVCDKLSLTTAKLSWEKLNTALTLTAIQRCNKLTHAESGWMKQWAADSSHLLEMIEAPQTCPLVWKCRLTCHGHSPTSAFCPPTIRLCLYGRTPQSEIKL